MPNQRQSHAERGDEADRKTQAGPLPGATGTFESLASLAWPLAFAASMSRAAASSLDAMALAFAQGQAEPTSPESEWATPGIVRLELPSLRLRDVSSGPAGPATVICAPFALHRATVADFAPGHSLVEMLREAGSGRLFVTDWRSATPEMRDHSIDTYLAELNVAVDEVGVPVNLVGLCQGGWLALVYAARFPGKVRRLVLAGAPVDIAAAPSPLARLVAETPAATFEALVRSGDGRVLGRHLLRAWSPSLPDEETDRILQIPPGAPPEHVHALEERFRHWYGSTVDLPGVYYLQVVRHVFKRNEIADGQFTALGRRIALKDVTMPVFLLAARDDEVVAPEQLMATADLIGTPRSRVTSVVEPCGHLGLFLGARTLAGPWRRIAGWLDGDEDGSR